LEGAEISTERGRLDKEGGKRRGQRGLLSALRKGPKGIHPLDGSIRKADAESLGGFKGQYGGGD